MTISGTKLPTSVPCPLVLSHQAVVVMYLAGFGEVLEHEVGLALEVQPVGGRPVGEAMVEDLEGQRKLLEFDVAGRRIEITLLSAGALVILTYK